MTGPFPLPAGTAMGGHVPAPVSLPGFGGHARDRDFRFTGAPMQEAEWSAFFRREWPLLLRYLLVRFSDSSAAAAADDAAQYAFIELYRSRGSVQAPRAWLRTVAARYLIKETHRDQDLLNKLTAIQEPSSAPVSGQELTEQGQAVVAILGRLSPIQRQVLALTMDGFSGKEIAEMLDTTEPAVRKSLQRGRGNLKEALFRK